MAATISGNTTFVARGVLRSVYAFVASATVGTVGRVLSAPQYPDKTVSIKGPFVSGVTIAIEGNNALSATATTGWFTLNDPQGNALSLATGKSEAILENPNHIRPRLSARTGTLGAPTVEIISQSTRR